jgi:hypothetical protein
MSEILQLVDVFWKDGKYMQIVFWVVMPCSVKVKGKVIPVL